jgi:hypothetical protein
LHLTPKSFMPHLRGLRVDHVVVTDHLLTLTLSATRSRAPCPLCQRPARRVHSRDTRTLADLPGSGVAVALRVQVRTFHSTNTACARRIFCERLPALAAAYGRQSHQLGASLRRIGFALGGRAGARLACAQGTPAGRTLLLRLVCRAPTPAVEAPRVLGVDDFAVRRGQR